MWFDDFRMHFYSQYECGEESFYGTFNTKHIPRQRRKPVERYRESCGDEAGRPALLFSRWQGRSAAVYRPCRLVFCIQKYCCFAAVASTTGSAGTAALLSWPGVHFRSVWNNSGGGGARAAVQTAWSRLEWFEQYHQGESLITAAHYIQPLPHDAGGMD